MRNTRVALIILATSLVMALIRPRWDPLMFSINWIVCFIGVVIVVTGAGVAITSFHKLFTGREATFSAVSDESLYYAAMTMFVAALLYGLLNWFGPLAR